MGRSTEDRAALATLRGSRWVGRINGFIRHPAYVVMLAVLTVISNLLGLDIYLYTGFILLGLYQCLFAPDLLGLMPIVILCYVAPSPANNPGSAANTDSIFLPENGGIYLFSILGVFIVFLLWRLITDPQIGGKAFLLAPRRLLSGMVLLGIAYLTSGLGMKEYATLWKQNLLFAALQFLAVLAAYYLFSGTVLWEKTRKDYMAWIGMCVGFVVLPQLLENYLSGRIFLEDSGTIDRELIYTGWGMHNNIGGMMAMMLPFPFYLARDGKHGWIYTVLAIVLMVGVVLSCSRTSIMVAAVAFLVCMALLLRRQETRRQNIRVCLVAGVVLAGCCLVFFDKLMDVFALFFQELFQVSQRDNLFVYGMKQFAEHPIFGGSFFPQGEYVPWDWSTSEAFSSFFPPRWHNTLVQVAASCGIVGLAAYAFHRFQTVRFLLRDRSPEKGYIAIYIAVLLACSLLDCHFFNIGPVLMYSMALAFAENIHRSQV